MSKLAELVESGLRPFEPARQEGTSVCVVGRVGARTCESDVVGGGKESLLGSVMEIPLEPPSLQIARLDDSGAGSSQFVKLGKALCLQALVVERHPDGGSHRGLDLRNSLRV